VENIPKAAPVCRRRRRADVHGRSGNISATARSDIIGRVDIIPSVMQQCELFPHGAKRGTWLKPDFSNRIFLKWDIETPPFF
jgi:hypothetical protein